MPVSNAIAFHVTGPVMVPHVNSSGPEQERSPMRIFLIVIAALAAAWGAYWYYGAQMVEKQAAAFQAAPDGSAGGLTHQGVAVGGFPYRFDVELAEPRFQDAARGIGWEAPFLQVHAMAYNPQHIIAVAPDHQTLRIGETSLQVNSDDMRASTV